MTPKFPLACLLAVLTASASANAAIIQFADRATFESALGPVTVQDFESFPEQIGAFEDVSFDFGDFSAFNDTNAFSGGDIAVPPVGNPEFGSTNVIWGATFINAAVFRLTFDTPILAIGFDSGELADQRTDEVTFDNTAGDSVAISDPSDTVRFWGFVSDTPFTTLTISQVGFGAGGGDGDGFTLDDVTYATSLPEPTMGALLVVAVAAACCRRRKA